jgi:hypothetical protein
VRRIGPGGERDTSSTIAGTSQARSSGFPRMAYAKGEVTLAWRDAGETPRVRAVVLGDPRW